MIRRTLLPAAAMVLAALAAEAMTPSEVHTVTREQLSLDTIVPENFGQWTYEPRVRLVQPEDPDALANQLYSQTLARAYRDPQGNLVMLLIAYGPSQSDQLQLHRPELCYAAQGFRVSDAAKGTLARDGGPDIPVVRLGARRESRYEPVTYWMRVGQEMPSGVLERQYVKLREGLAGRIPDGLLVRVSSLNGDPQSAFELHERFVRDLLGVVDPRHMKFLLGAYAGDRQA